MLSFFLSKTGLTLIGAALIAGYIGVLHLELSHTRNDLLTARTQLAAAEDREKASETLRAAEYAKATSDLSEAERACSARVAQAVGQGVVIKRIVQRVPVLDPRGCPINSLVSTDDLRKALQP